MAFCNVMHYVCFSDIIETANHLSEKFGSSIRIRHISECNDEYFLVLHETLLGESLPGMNFILQVLEWCYRLVRY